MLKGHADIYLKDAKTGEIVDERHEDNIVTNAVQDLINMNPFGIRRGLQYVLPLATKALGGVLLFPKAIPEDKDDYFAHDQWPTGYASNGVDTGADPRRGNFNANESYATANGYRLVWDFGTADANGDISCVCLTNANGGESYLFGGTRSTDSNETINNSIAIYIICQYNGVNVPKTVYHDGAFYGFTYTYESSKIKTLKLHEWKIPPLMQPLARPSNPVLDSPNTMDIDLSDANIAKSFALTWDDSGAHFLWGWNTGEDIHMTHIAWDGNVTNQTIALGDMTNLYGLSDSLSHIASGWIYLQFRYMNSGASKLGFYAIDLSNTSDIRELVTEFGPVSYYSSTAAELNHAFAVTFGYLRYGTSDCWNVAFANGEIIEERINNYIYYYEQHYGHIGPFLTMHRTGLSNNDTFIYLALDNTYLATINNLATPITKTADRTLKIVYTLTETSE